MNRSHLTSNSRAPYLLLALAALMLISLIRPQGADALSLPMRMITCDGTSCALGLRNVGSWRGAALVRMDAYDAGDVRYGRPSLDRIAHTDRRAVALVKRRDGSYRRVTIRDMRARFRAARQSGWVVLIRARDSKRFLVRPRHLAVSLSCAQAERVASQTGEHCYSCECVITESSDTTWGDSAGTSPIPIMQLNTMDTEHAPSGTTVAEVPLRLGTTVHEISASATVDLTVDETTNPLSPSRLSCQLSLIHVVTMNPEDAPSAWEGIGFGEVVTTEGSPATFVDSIEVTRDGTPQLTMEAHWNVPDPDTYEVLLSCAHIVSEELDPGMAEHLSPISVTPNVVVRAPISDGSAE